MTSPLRLCVRRSPAPDAEGAATLVTLRLPSDVSCIEEAVELVIPAFMKVFDYREAETQLGAFARGQGRRP